MPQTKIATCCYCGTRAALVLRGRDRHELSCASCGAPLRELKMLRVDHGGRRDPARASQTRRIPAPHRVIESGRKRGRRRKSVAAWILEEAWDAIEDIFD